jgi:Lon protease-like protein
MPDFQHLPLFPLNTVLFPGVTLPLRIFEPRYQLLLQHCVEKRAPFGVVMIRADSEVGGEVLVLSAVGTTARVTKCEAVVDETYLIEVEGETRFIINETYDDEPYLTARVTPFWEQAAEPLDLQPLYDQTTTLFKEYLANLQALENKHLANLQMPQDPVMMSFVVAASLQASLDEKQSLLEIAATSERLQREIEILQRTNLPVEAVEVFGSDAPAVMTFEPLEAAEVQLKMSRN